MPNNPKPKAYKKQLDRFFDTLSSIGVKRLYVTINEESYVYPTVGDTRKRQGKRFLIFNLFVLLLSISLLAYMIGDSVFSGSSGTGQGTSPDQNELKKRIIRLIAENENASENDILHYLNTGESVNQRDAYGWTPLHWAAFTANETLFRFLLKNGADKTLKSTRSWYRYPAGMTPGDIKEIKKIKKK